MKFKGKISWWFPVLLAGVAALLTPLLVFSAWIEPNAAALVTVSVVLAAVELFGVPMLVRNFVELQNDELRIVFGWIVKRIPCHEIASLSPTRSPLASLACSFDRVEIRCRDGASILISLTDKTRFLAEMQRRFPGIEIL